MNFFEHFKLSDQKIEFIQSVFKAQEWNDSEAKFQLKDKMEYTAYIELVSEEDIEGVDSKDVDSAEWETLMFLHLKPESSPVSMHFVIDYNGHVRQFLIDQTVVPLEFVSDYLE